MPVLMRALLGALVVLAAGSCSGADSGSDSDDGASDRRRGPGFAVEGSLETGFTVHLYRFKGDVSVGLHPRAGEAVIEAAGAKEVCDEEVCVPFEDGKAVVDFQGANAHYTLVIRNAARIEEATLSYQAADNFLAVDFPR